MIALFLISICVTLDLIKHILKHTLLNTLFSCTYVLGRRKEKRKQIIKSEENGTAFSIFFVDLNKSYL